MYKEVTKLVKIKLQDAAEIFKHANLTDSAIALKKSASSFTDFVNCLLKNDLYQDVIQMLAYGLPKFEVIWWGYLCVNHYNETAKNAATTSGLAVIKKWAYEPTETNRRMIEHLLEETKYDLPVDWLAMAVFWSGGSIGSPNQPDVIPESHLSKTWVVGAINLAAVLNDPAKARENYQTYINLGMDIVNGGKGVNS